MVDSRYVLLDDPLDLRFETHIKHTISLVQYQVTDIREAYTTALDKVNETAGGGTE
jgi:hypothetical protein